jgi:predicted TPR repeat methyltransferase
MIPIASDAAVERCLAALCGGNAVPAVGALPLQSFGAAYRSIARRAASRPAHVRANIAAVVHAMRGDADGAVACLERSLAIEFNQYAFQFLLADVLVRAGRWEAYERKGEFGLEIVGALEGIARPPERYHALLLGKLFDRLSGEYDERVAREGYAEHTQLALAIARLAPAGRRLRLLDLGCGTGMLADALRAAGVDAALVGVDLSEAMLARARERGLYEALHRDDIEHFLRAESDRARFDGTALASVIPFFGDLGRLFDLLAAGLRAGAWVAFTYDVAQEDGPQFNEHGRYRHGKAYVEARLAGAGFRVESSERFVAREERSRPVIAEALVARRA